MRPPLDLKLPAGWRRTDYYIGTRTDTWRIYTYRDYAISKGEVLYGELWRMTGEPRVMHRGSIESCIEFARAAR